MPILKIALEIWLSKYHFYFADEETKSQRGGCLKIRSPNGESVLCSLKHSEFIYLDILGMELGF